MKKIIVTLVLLFTVAINAQKYQRIGYIDMEYILQNVPEYTEAQNTLNSKVEKWKSKLDKEARHIEVLKTDLANEKAILTKDLIQEREEEIQLKQEQLRNLEALYFGPNGDMYNLRKQLIQPVQDQVYNSVQSIAARKKYDFIFDKSSELVMLYSNKKHDISDLVLKSIGINKKRKEKKEKIESRKKAKSNTTNELTDAQKAQIEKKIEAKNKKEAKKIAKQKALQEKREARKKRLEEKRRLLKEKREALRKAREEAKKKKQEEKQKNN